MKSVELISIIDMFKDRMLSDVKHEFEVRTSLGALKKAATQYNFFDVSFREWLLALRQTDSTSEYCNDVVACLYCPFAKLGSHSRYSSSKTCITPEFVDEFQRRCPDINTPLKFVRALEQFLDFRRNGK